MKNKDLFAEQVVYKDLDTGIDFSSSSFVKQAQTLCDDIKGGIYRVLKATHPSGRREYVLFEGVLPVYATQEFEAMCAHIHMILVNEKFNQDEVQI